jgi:hypothetical protein
MVGAPLLSTSCLACRKHTSKSQKSSSLGVLYNYNKFKSVIQAMTA